MRGVKFRAWDTSRKTMFVDGLGIGFHGVLLQWVEQYKDHYAFSPSSRNLIIMQYTGLKDKNTEPVEIYDGDILQCDDSNADYQLYAKVYWDEEEAKWKADRTGDGETCEFELIEILHEHQFVDVIGNIYENPELLEQAA